MTRIDPSKRIQKRRSKEEMMAALQQFIKKKHTLHVPPEMEDPDVVLMDAIRELMDLRARFEEMTQYHGGPTKNGVLSSEQQADVHMLKYRMAQALVAKSEAFRQLHPELCLVWSLECNAYLRAEGTNEKMMNEDIRASLVNLTNWTNGQPVHAMLKRLDGVTIDENGARHEHWVDVKEVEVKFESDGITLDQVTSGVPPEQQVQVNQEAFKKVIEGIQKHENPPEK